MVAYTKSDQGKSEDFLLLVNFERVANVIPVSQLEAASARPGFDKVVPFGQIAGLDVQQTPLVGTMRLDNLERGMVRSRAPPSRDGSAATRDDG
jgi:hypothetical protein